MAKVAENQQKLNGCKRHHFTYEKVRLGQPLRCDICGGTMQLTDAGWYVKGYMAAGGNPDDVWPGWLGRRATSQAGNQ